ncbi:HNH endonuclease [Glutamicibacter sp.]|uniref:HNH endonuclease n=1 Tax=Glutamicibacter sp. TaxID=1931995 RepID=UPI002B4A1F63|nr:HNH endonuclease [Glutamicibacter sp.]HJX77284.1 HNH endonuclease [Glutamicibacter sp.]
MAGDGQTSRRYRQLRKAFLDACSDKQAQCWLCSMPIDYTIPWPDDEAFELDHLYPRSTHPEHAEDPANFRASHRRCNNKRSNKMQVGGLGTLKRNWLKG